METIQKRIALLKDGKELCLGIQKNNTNLRIWTGKDANGKYPPSQHDTIFIRLDQYKSYSVPLNNETFNYLNDENKDTIELLLKYGFKSSIDNMLDILTITEVLKEKNLLSW